MKNQSNGATPPSERIISLDLLRGIAVLGILIMNIQSFAMISAAYINPTAFGNFTGIHKITWIFNNLMASEKFINIFSILFGAGVILLYERKKSQGANVWWIQLKRNFWLLVFGLIHAYLIWYGDILVYYSMCGIFVFLFRKLDTKPLIAISAVFFIVPPILSVASGLTVSELSAIEYGYSVDAWLPDKEKIAAELAAIKGSYPELIKYRFHHLKYMHTYLFAELFFWRVSALMFMGMALFKNGFLTAKKTAAFYRKVIIIGLPLGAFFSIFGMVQNFKASWQMEYSMYFGHLYNYFGSIATSLAYISIAMLFAKSPKYTTFKQLISSTGKMAFTNYILMSVICGLLFYGIGFNLFGQVERFQQLLVVIAVWAILISFSFVWLKNYYFGPLEWLWRFLTYGKKPPFKREQRGL
jgi:uncharacterized protein